MRKRADAPKRKRQSASVAPRVITKLSKRAKRTHEAEPCAHQNADLPDQDTEPQMSGGNEVRGTVSVWPCPQMECKLDLKEIDSRQDADVKQMFHCKSC